VRFEHDPGDPKHGYALRQGVRVPLAPFLAEHDIVVNCVLQNPDVPLTFVTDEEVVAFTPGSLIVDVSCDEGMGFGWARPTTFADPMFTVGDNVHYYGVDHSPSLLWDSASWEISEALLPHLRTVLDGPKSWDADQTIRRAIEIRDGVVQNPTILSFQHRSPRYPHAFAAAESA
jgi:alanine dehydrogenase